VVDPSPSDEATADLIYCRAATGESDHRRDNLVGKVSPSSPVTSGRRHRRRQQPGRSTRVRQEERLCEGPLCVPEATTARRPILVMLPGDFTVLSALRTNCAQCLRELV